MMEGQIGSNPKCLLLIGAHIQLFANCNSGGNEVSMGWRFRRSFRIIPGIRLNMGRSGFTSVSVGGRGATLNLGKRGVTSTISLPGTGLSYQHRYKAAQSIHLTQQPVPSLTPPSGWTTLIRTCVVGILLLGGYLAFRSITPLAPPPVPTATSAPTPKQDLTTLQYVRPLVDEQTGTVRSPSIQERQITTVQANVRITPSMSGAVVRTLMRGQKVQALTTENGWTRVAEQDGEPIGWMHNSVLK